MGLLQNSQLVFSFRSAVSHLSEVPAASQIAVCPVPSGGYISSFCVDRAEVKQISPHPLYFKER